MSRFIDADAYLHELEELIRARLDWTSIGKIEIQGLIVAICELENQPTADVVEVVRCKDCVYWEQATDNSGNCNRAFEITAYGSDYCSYGERREDAN